MTTFGERVRERRLALGMTLQAVADKTDCSKSYVWEIENRDTSPSIYLAVKLALCLKTNVYGLMGIATPNRGVDKPRKKRTVKKPR